MTTEEVEDRIAELAKIKAREEELLKKKRDKMRFTAACHAMQGYIASNTMELYSGSHDECMKDICESAVKYADQLIEELEK